MFEKKLKMYCKTGIIAILSLALLMAPAMAAGEMSGVRSISDTNVQPGDTFSVTVTMYVNADVTGPAIQEFLPDGWVASENENDGLVFSSYDTAWLYVGALEAGDSKTVVYDVTVPENASEGTYDITGVYEITGEVSAYDVEGIEIDGDTQVTVSDDGGSDNNNDNGVTADFSANITYGEAPLTVQFTDESVNASSWAWDFDNDGVTDSTEQNPVYTYTAQGIYTVALTAAGSDDTDTKTITDYITVSSGNDDNNGGNDNNNTDNNTTTMLIEADFSANITSGEAPLTVQFTDESVNASSWTWDFDDDGVTDSAEQNPVYTYTADGVYTVVLTVAGDEGNDTKTMTDYITVSSESDDDDANATNAEASSVTLSATIIPSISIEVTPGAIDFGNLAPGETSDSQNIKIKNKGALNAEITAEVIDVAKDLYVDGLKLDSENWEVFSTDVSRNNSQTVEACLEVPSDFIGVGSMEGKVVFWAEM